MNDNSHIFFTESYIILRFFFRLENSSDSTERMMLGSGSPAWIWGTSKKKGTKKWYPESEWSIGIFFLRVVQRLKWRPAESHWLADEVPPNSTTEIIQMFEHKSDDWSRGVVVVWPDSVQIWATFCKFMQSCALILWKTSSDVRRTWVHEYEYAFQIVGVILRMICKVYDIKPYLLLNLYSLPFNCD